MATLGVMVLSLPGMRQLAECLKSVQWADAIVVLHAGEDEPRIPERRPSVLTVRKLVPGEELKSLRGETRTDWVLHLLGEERVEPELSDELHELCRSDFAKTSPGYRVSIRTYVLGRWVEGSLWGPSPSLRLTRGLVQLPYGWWNAKERPYEEPPGRLWGWIGDYSALDLSDAVALVNGVTSLWAEGLQHSPSHGPAALALHPFRVFLRLLWRNRVLAKGLAGLTLSTLAAYATLLSGAKLWESQNVPRRRSPA